MFVVIHSGSTFRTKLPKRGTKMGCKKGAQPFGMKMEKLQRKAIIKMEKRKGNGLFIMKMENQKQKKIIGGVKKMVLPTTII